MNLFERINNINDNHRNHDAWKKSLTFGDIEQIKCLAHWKADLAKAEDREASREKEEIKSFIVEYESSQVSEEYIDAVDEEEAEDIFYEKFSNENIINVRLID